jgi:hypothetical protein
MLMVLLGISTVSARCQDENIVTKVEFTSLTRGHQKEVFISADSLIIYVSHRGENKMIKRKLEAGEWDELLVSIPKINREELSTLPSPTSRRAFDGAKHSVIQIYGKDAGPWSHSFDDENPHELLHPLMDVIKRIASPAFN